MLDSSVFETPDDAPAITEYVKLCQALGKTKSIDPHVLVEELEALQVVWLEATRQSMTADPDKVFYVIRNVDGKPVSTVLLDKQTWMNLLAMEAMDDDDGTRNELLD